MKNILFIVISLSFFSCTSINRQSSDHYNATKTFRHGMVPISNNTLPKTKTEKKSVQVDLKTLAKGKALYNQNCISCHGKTGEGNGPKSNELKVKPANLVKIVKNVPNFKMYMMVSQWQGEMPGWKSLLSDKEISHVRNYILHLSNSKPRIMK